MASNRTLNVFNDDNVTINVVEETDNQVVVVNENPSVEVITIYEQGPQGPRGEKGDTIVLPTEIISGSGANNLLALFASGGYITGSKNLSFDGSNLSISGSVYISTFSGSAVSLTGISQDNNLTNITIGSGLNLLDNTLNAVGSLTGTGSIAQLAFWTASKAISGSQNLVYDYTNGRLGINNSNPQYALDVSGTIRATSFEGLFPGIISSSQQVKENLPLGTVSGSNQLTSSYDVRYELRGSNIVSGSSQVKNLLPDGTVSSSAQIAADISGSFLVTSASFSLRIGGIENKTGSFATTGSNIFFGNQTINGSILAGAFTGSAALITGDVLVEGKVTAREFFTQYISSSIIYQSGSTKFGDTQDDTHQFTGSIYLSGSLINVSHIDFSTSSYSTNASARITWNPDFGTLDLGVVGGNVNLSWGLEVAAYVVNGESTTLLDGEVVYMSGSRGDKPKVYRASSVTELTSTKTFGVVTEHILPNQLGYVTTQGVVNGLNLDSFNSGDAVWLGTIPGTFTATKPQAPTHSVFVGIVQRANAGDGQLYVKVQNGYELDELHNVRITNPLNGQLLTYDQAQQIWVNGNTLSGSYFVSGSIQAISFTGSLLGTASYANIVGSGGVLGSAGVNQIAFWNGTSSITGNSNMTVESANTRLRIGNIYYGAGGITTTQGGSAASIGINSANRNINVDGNLGIGTSPTALLHISGSSNSTLFEIDSPAFQNILFVSGSGNIGIATNNPAYKLDVIGNGRFRGLGTTSATTTFRAENSTGAAGLIITDDQRAYFGGAPNLGGNINYNGTLAGGHLVLGYNTTQAPYIYAYDGASQAVSLGTNGTIVNAGVVVGSRFMRSSAMFEVISTTKGLLTPRMTLTQRDSITSPAEGLILYVTSSLNDGLYYYNSGSYQGWTRLLGSSGSQKLTGSLDILGTLNTSVYSGSSAYISGDVYVGGTVTAREFYTQIISSSVIYQSGSTKFGDSLDDIHERTGSFRVTGSGNHYIIGGNFGLATINPTAKLHVSGTSNSGLFEIDSDSAQNIIYVSGSGNVGIGTNNPAFRLDVTAPSRIHSIYIGQGLGSGNVYMGESVGGQAGSLMDQNVFIGTLAGRSFTGNANGNTAVGYNALQGGNNAEYNTAVGHFALGNNSAGQYNVAMGAFAGNDATSGPNTFIGYNTGRGITTGTGNTIIGSNVTGLSTTLSNTVIIADSSGNRRINVDSSGNTSLGVVSASARLHVNSSGTTSATYGLQIHNATGTNNALTVRDDGSVGIRTNSPVETLTVNGSISANWGSGLKLSENLLSIVRGSSTNNLGIRYINTWDYYQGHVFTSTANFTSTAAVNASILSIDHGWAPISVGSTNYRPFANYYTINATAAQTGTVSGIYTNATQTNLNGALHYLINLNVNNSNKFRVDNNGIAFISGSLGIGTNNPAYTLDVVGSGDFSGGLTVTGSFQLSGSLFQYSDNTDVDIGTEVVTSVATGSYRSAFFDYVITSGSNARAGTVFSVWGGSTVEYTETSTNDIGSTTPVSLFVALNGANVELRATTTADNWSVKSLARML